MSSYCEHQNAELVARRDGVDYVRCRDCGQVFEAGDVDAFLDGEDEPEEEQ